ncbi:DUF1775 domain-containing protein [Modestobacter muralis]|uniref:DUF1775 domain-containing protein n=1 Tax=Modestobacter muralis TaxID=1608614 RepID=UPI001B8AB559
MDAEYSVTVAQLPAGTTELAFPILQRYSDGREDAWIEPVTDAVPAPAKPASILSMAAAPGGATCAPPTPVPSAAGWSAVSTSAAETAAASSPQLEEDTAAQVSGKGNGVGVPVVVGSIVVLVAQCCGSLGCLPAARMSRLHSAREAA